MIQTLPATDALRDPARLSELHALGRLDTPPDEVFDRHTRLAARILKVPVVMFNLIDRDRQFVKSSVGLPELLASTRQMPLSHSFCKYVVASREALVIQDMRQSAPLRDHPAVADFGVLAYAGFPLTTPDGAAIGSLCAIDYEPHAWTPDELAMLGDLAATLNTEIRLRYQAAQRRREAALLEAEKQVLQRISRAAPLPEVLDALARAVEAQTPGTRATVLLRDAGATHFRLGSAPSLPREIVARLDGVGIEAGAIPCAAAVLGGEWVAVPELAGSPECAALADLLVAHGLRAATSAPIVGSAGEVLGAVAVYLGEPRTLSAWEIDVLRRAPAELLGHRFSELVAPDHRARVEQAYQSGMQGERERMQTEFEVIRPSGERRRVQAHAASIRQNDRTVGTHGLIRDITDERERQGWMRVFAAALGNLQEGVSVLDPAGHFLYSNAAHCRILGYEPGDAPPEGVKQFLPDAEAERQVGEIMAASRARGSWIGRVRRRRMDGRVVPMEMRVERVEQDGRELFFTILRDVSDELEREGRLRRAERLAGMGTLISGVAHELNNPLSAIRGFGELLLLDETSPDRREDLQTICRETDRMAKIVSDLRLVARETQDDGGDAAREMVDLNDVVRHVLRTREYAHTTRNIEVRDELAPDLPAVYGHRSQLEQVVLNLVVNAEQAMDGVEGPKWLIVRTRSAPRGVTLQVVDRGAGIAPEHLERIFNPFWTTKAPGEGTGLGLSLVHSIVADHGGEIRVDSQVGEGTAFRIELPRAAEGVPAPPVEAPAVPAPIRALRVLVVDDEAANRTVITRYLALRGHHAVAASDGGAALRHLQQDSYDVIVSDLRMPGVDGEQLLRRLREGGEGMERRVIFLTGDAASEDARRVLHGSNVPVLLKPVVLPELAAAVERHAERLRGADVGAG